MVLLSYRWVACISHVAPLLQTRGFYFSPCSFLTDAWLVFEVELISIGDAPPVVNVFKQIDGDADDHLSKEEVRTGRGSVQGACPLLVAVTVATASLFLAA